MAKYITEVLKEINEDPNLINTTYKMQGDGGPLRKLFFHAFVPQYKFLLPSGEPPFKPAAEPIGLTPSHMMNEIRKFYILCDPNVRPYKREEIFIEMLENMHPDEAKVLLAVKEQNLTALYPNITYKSVANAGFIPQPQFDIEPVTESVVVETPKKKRGRPPKTKPSEDH